MKRTRWMGWLAAVLGAVAMGPATEAGAAQAGELRTAWTLAPRVRSEVHLRSLYGNLKQPVAMVANNPAQWDRAMARLLEEGALLTGPAEAAADLGVDWKRHAVVLVGLGEQVAGRYSVDVAEVRRRAGDLLLDVRVNLDDSGAQQMTSPYCLVLVERGRWDSVSCFYDVASMTAGGPGGRGAGDSKGGRTGRLEAGAAQAGSVTWSEVKAGYR